MEERQVLTADQLRCLVSPARKDVYACVRTLGRASAGEVAAHLQKPLGSVHYHLNQLAAAGLVREAFRRPTARRPESVFEATAKRVELPGRDDPEILELRIQAVLTDLRATMRRYEIAERRAAEKQSSPGSTHVLRINTRLSPERLAEFYQLLEAASQYAGEHANEDGQPVQWTSIVHPF